MNKYEAYIQSDEWKQLRLELLQSRGCKCQDCGKTKHHTKLQVHHLTYERLFEELPQDLVILCRKCHMKQHEDKIPTKVLAKYGVKKVKPKKKKSGKKKSVFQVVKEYNQGKIKSKNQLLNAYRKSIKGRHI